MPIRVAKKVSHSTGRECGSEGCPALGKIIQGSQDPATFENIFRIFLILWAHAKKSRFKDVDNLSD